MEHYLVIVARDRPELFQHLYECHGHEMKVILDRRQRPRPPIPGRRDGRTVWYATMQREGFMVVPAKRWSG